MTKIDSYKSTGEKSTEIELMDSIFNVKSKDKLIHQAVFVQLNNSRFSNAHAKDRSEISGGGKKPWKQKGTGNARAGSSRSPLWIGGGVTFGPRNTRNWHRKLSKKMRSQTIFMALTEKLAEKKLIVMDELKISKPKTKEAENIVKNLPIKEGTILLVIEKSEPNIELSFRNLPFVKTTVSNSINIYDIMKYDWVVLTKDAIKAIEKIFIDKEKVKKEKKQIKKSAKKVKKENNIKAKVEKTKNKK